MCFLFQYLEAHLKFLAFFLQEATLYLGWNRAREIWECLVTGQDVCELDREVRNTQVVCGCRVNLTCAIHEPLFVEVHGT